MKKWLQLIAILAIGIIVLAACGSSSDSDSDANSEDTSQDTEESADTNEEDASSSDSEETKTYEIGATQIVEHPSLDKAYEGFQAAIKDAGLKVEYNFQSAQNDQNNVKPISDGFVGDNVDLIFANSTPSALGAVQATEAAKDIPIVFTSVTDAVDAGLVTAMDEPGENITGVTDMHPDAIKKTVDFIDANFPDSAVGFIYNSGEPNSVSQIESITKAFEGTSLSIVERSVANASEVLQAANTLVSEVDVFYIFTDNTVVEALDTVVGVANEQDIPLVVGEPNSLEQGGFVTFGIDYYKIGYRTGEMAVEILTGEKTTKDIPVEYPPEIQLYINKDAAEEQNIEWNDEWDEKAEFMETIEK